MYGFYIAFKRQHIRVRFPVPLCMFLTSGMKMRAASGRQEEEEAEKGWSSGVAGVMVAEGGDLRPWTSRCAHDTYILPLFHK